MMLEKRKQGVREGARMNVYEGRGGVYREGAREGGLQMVGRCDGGMCKLISEARVTDNMKGEIEGSLSLRCS